MTGAPRHDLGAERAVLGAILQSQGRALDRLDLDPADHYRDTHERLHRALAAMYASGSPIDPVTIHDHLATDPIKGIDGPYLHDLLEASTTWTNVGHYARIVATNARLRGMAAAGTRITQRAETAELDDVEDVVNAARADLDAAALGTDRGDAETIGSLLATAMDRWETPDTDMTPTGWYDLDAMLSGGLRPGHLCVIGARPGVGKSVAATVVASHAAASGIGTLISSLEMSKLEVTNRIVSNHTGVDLQRQPETKLTELDWKRVANAHATMGAWPLYVDDRAGVTLAAIRGRAQDCTRRPKGLGLVIVDYLQLVRPTDHRVPRQEQVAAIARGLKLMARDLAVPVIALCQVNRSAMTRTDKRPVMSDLRESGEIEAAADEIILLHRDDEEAMGEIELNVEKNRHGRTGRVSLAWAPHRARISSIARYGEAS